MTLELTNPRTFLGLVDPEKGTVDRRIFSDPDIYQLELEQIFARAWNFVAHGSQIPNPGDFFMTFIGEDRVIVVRDNDMQPQVLINSCRHRGNAVCRAEEGHATSFMCTYHGWTYDLKGNLVGVPGFKEVYHEELDRDNWGLIKAAKVDEYKGFIFANMDPEAPELSEYLGDVGRLCIDEIAVRGDLEVAGGIQKYVIPCNWKFAVDNVWDYYHSGITHASGMMAGWFQRPKGGPSIYELPHIAVLGEYGHVISGPANSDSVNQQRLSIIADVAWREKPETKEVLGTLGMRAGGHPHIFPNMWMTTPGYGQVSLRIPKGPASTEIWWFTFVDRNAAPEKRSTAVHRANHMFGPAGMFEQEDGENWGESTRGARGVRSSAAPLHYGMGVGHGEIVRDENELPHVNMGFAEHGQLWHYRAWSEWMSATSWADLRAIHSRIPDRV
ncbi:MAG: aromatic ring-hydroxylating dioxygenase subunit alpha [Dehalococcoidia bacterium]